MSCRCESTGKLSHDTGWVEYAPPPEGYEGEYVSGERTLSSSLCPCRRDLPPREGEATWWSSENVYSEVCHAEVYGHVIEISVSAEIPISEDNYRLVMRGNRYYPCFVDVELTDRDDRSFSMSAMFPAEARAFAAALIAAADKCDEIDEPCTGADGTWG